ncbi:glycosyltransferase family 2 protein [Laspinema olomoucense]|uniref:Glycosyltransferase family 2 protein n=1 Tax=Laspinema olomoucense D3b TaxID=2953688 RepID=A0ABT2N0R4_9CYAN|nr:MULTISPECIES: glycosyltransferase family A protein [unclassified Laspinema]MCT7970923.1 glycosyltransferase family 2 protein [Laspinema sp. D3d]MCT7976256.1 glycosyltransferase family 2 protein [Laspinema sp. D3b]MCT7995760.1 glycosyltransferase family 2 protein [Laspinema sp. D3c]
MPKISVIIPAYNAEATILETIDSVLKQTFTDFELLVINDGSQDNTQTVVESISDSRVRVISYPNGGVCVARNRGIFLAKGELIAFLDADDLWTLDKLEKQYTALQEHPEAGVAYSWTCFMDITDSQTPPTFLPSLEYQWTGNVYKNLLVQDFIHSGSNTLMRREAIASVGEFDQTCAGCADWDYWLRLAAKWPFVVVKKCQIFYRRMPGSMSSKVEVMEREALIAMEKAYKAAPPELQHLKTLTFTNFHKYCAELYLQRSQDRDAMVKAQKHVKAAIALQPSLIIGDRTFQKILVKLLIKKLLPKPLANYLFHSIRKSLSIPDPRLQPGNKPS